MYTKKDFFKAVRFVAALIIILLAGCRNNPAPAVSTEEEEEADSIEQAWERPAQTTGENQETSLATNKDTVPPHSQVMKRYLKDEEYNTTHETRIGKLLFTGYKPSHHMKEEGFEAYHNGSLEKLGVEEGITYWEGDGDVWIIYHDPNQLGKHNFKIHGRLQEKMDFK